MIDSKVITRRIQNWLELMDIGFEMALSAIETQFPGRDPLIEYRRRWRIWQDDHLEAGIRYLEVISRDR